jgi:hypothetical protein
VPFGVLRRLTHLTIWNCVTIDRIGVIFAQSASLVCLALVQVAGERITRLFRENPASFPHLLEFKLMLLDQMESAEQGTIAICNFLRGRPLHRIDLNMPGGNVRLFLDILPEFVKLRALGIDARGLSSDQDVEFLASQLPDGLVALHTQHPWEGLTLDSYEIQPLVSTYLSLSLKRNEPKNSLPSS